MTYRAFFTSRMVMIVGVAVALGAPCHTLMAQALDSTGMPSLEQLALEAGRASRRHPIRAVERAMLCDPSHPLVDSASAVACITLDSTRAAAITAAFAHGLEVPLAATPNSDAPVQLPSCPPDVERVAEPRVLVGRVTPPLVGVREGVWEGRITLELRCRPTGGGSAVRTMGKEYLYQWSGREWRLYQFGWWHRES